MSESFAPLLHEDPDILSRRRSQLPYAAEAWVFYRKQIRLLERFHQRCLRSILGIKWQTKKSSRKPACPAQSPSCFSIRMTKEAFFSKQQEGKRNRGAPRKSYKRPAEETRCRDGNQLRRPQTETAGAHQREPPVTNSRQTSMKPQRKDTGGRKTEQHPIHRQPKTSPA